MPKRKFAPVHPGIVLTEDYLKPMKIGPSQLARRLGVPPSRIEGIVNGNSGISADTALRLGRFFGMDAQEWMNLQSLYDLEVAKDALAGKLEHEVQALKTA
ncbi:MAG: HigA family addiction module antitoxin [Betaproteobacteria bacterium]